MVEEINNGAGKDSDVLAQQHRISVARVPGCNSTWTITLGTLITPERSVSALSTTLCPVTYLSHFHEPGQMGSHKSRLASSGWQLRFKYTRNWMRGHTDVKEAQWLPFSYLRFTQNHRSPNKQEKHNKHVEFSCGPRTWLRIFMLYGGCGVGHCSSWRVSSKRSHTTSLGNTESISALQPKATSSGKISLEPCIMIYSLKSPFYFSHEALVSLMIYYYGFSVMIIRLISFLLPDWNLAEVRDGFWFFSPLCSVQSLANQKRSTFKI